MEDKNLPRVSIVTGFYNREDYVIDSIQSLLDQDYTNLEIIIFDDCSTDSTFEKIREVCADSPKVRMYKHESNLGFVQGMINAIELSTGDFIAVHGSGDISLKRRISKQVQYLTNNFKSVGVGCHFANVDNGNSIYKVVERVGVFKQDDFYSSNPFSHGEIMYRKDIYKRAGGYRRIFKFSQDLDLWIRMSEFGHFGIVEEILYERIINFTGASYSPSKIILQRKYSVLAKEINKLTIDEQVDKINSVKELGINTVISSRNILVQKHLLFMFNVLCVKNQLNDVYVFLDNSFGWRHLYFIVVSNLMKINVFQKSLNFFYKRIVKG